MRPPRRTLVALALAAVLLVVAPLSVTAARQSTFTASTELRETRSQPPPGALPSHGSGRAYLEALLARAAFARSVGVIAPFIRDRSTLRRRVRISERLASGRRVYTIAATAGSPREARRLAGAVANLAFYSSGVELARAIDAELGRARARLERRDLPASERRRLRRRIAALRGAPARPEPFERVDGTVAAGRLTGSVDRLLDRLPGAYPEKPEPAAAAVAGGLCWVAFAVWTLLLMTRRPGERAVEAAE
jgi:hypothetical protein